MEARITSPHKTDDLHKIKPALVHSIVARAPFLSSAIVYAKFFCQVSMHQSIKIALYKFCLLVLFCFVRRSGSTRYIFWEYTSSGKSHKL